MREACLLLKHLVLLLAACIIATYSTNNFEDLRALPCKGSEEAIDDEVRAEANGWGSQQSPGTLQRWRSKCSYSWGSTHRTATDTSADPEVMPPQPAVRPQARPQRPEDEGVGQELANDPTTSGAEQLRLSSVNQLGLFSMDESTDFEEPALPRSRSHSTSRPSSGLPVIPTFTLEVPASSASPQSTPFVPRRR